MHSSPPPPVLHIHAGKEGGGEVEKNSKTSTRTPARPAYDEFFSSRVAN